MNRIKFPKYLVATESLDAPCWIVRTRSPFVMGRCEAVGIVGVKLFCWPPEIRELPKISKIVSTMAEIYAEDIEKLPGLPSRWAYAFNEAEKPPKFLVGDNYHSEFSAVIHSAAPRFLLPLDDDSQLSGDLIPLEEELPSSELVMMATKFYERFKREEDESAD